MGTEKLSPITTKGDIIVGDNTGDAARFPVGPTGTVMISDPSATYGWTYGTPGGGATGATGATGPQGTQGSQGSVGPQGTQGTQGSAGSSGLPINSSTAPSYTFQSTDIGKIVSLNATGVITAHIPNPLGNAEDQIIVRNGAGGAILINGATGVTLNGASFDLGQQWSEVVLVQETATNTWWVASSPKGATGPTGPSGATGATGATGPQGTQGSQGSLGPTGPQGTQGTIGNDGAQGTQGTQGSQGSVGTNYNLAPNVTSLATAGSPAPNALSDMVYKLTNQDQTANFKITGGTANDGQIMYIYIHGTTGLTKNITWPDATFGYTANFVFGGTQSQNNPPTIALPLTTVRGKTIRMQFQYDTMNSLNRWVLFDMKYPI